MASSSRPKTYFKKYDNKEFLEDHRKSLTSILAQLTQRSTESAKLADTLDEFQAKQYKDRRVSDLYIKKEKEMAKLQQTKEEVLRKCGSHRGNVLHHAYTAAATMKAKPDTRVDDTIKRSTKTFNERMIERSKSGGRRSSFKIW